MPRGNRYFLPGYVWHITHRCHKREFLLKFGRDQRRWLQWLFEARKRFGVSILNYSVTSNHIHLILMDIQGEKAIPQTMQLIAGRTGQEFNQRKKRKGAFWEDRYHATAIEADSHLAHCMVYVDLNMVRAGVVKHPSEWPFCGYNEIQNPRLRKSLIDHESLLGSFGAGSMEEFKQVYRGWVSEALEKGKYRERQSWWTESIAFGSEGFVGEVKEKLGAKALCREIVGTNGSYELRESMAAYEKDFAPQNEGLRYENAFFWNISR
jgi:putative transposase